MSKNLLIITLLLLLSIGIVSASGENPLQLSNSSGAVAEWATGTYVSGSQAHLQTTGIVGTGKEARITINPSSVGVTTLSTLNTISWNAKNVTGYLPHVDVYLDLNDDGVYNSSVDDVLVFEYAKVNNTNCDNSPYPTGNLNTFYDKGNVNNNAYAWLTTGDAGACGSPTYYAHSLADWKLGQTANGKTINGNSKVLYLQIENDNWILQSEAYVNNISINNANFKPFTSPIASFSKDEDFNTFGLDLTANGTDIEDSSLNWSITGTNSSLVTINQVGNVFTFNSVANQSGVVNLNFTATDSGNGQDSFVTTFTVNQVNDNPMSNGLSNPSSVNEDSGLNDNAFTVAQLNSAFSDVEENNLPTSYTIQSQSNTTTISCSLDGSNNIDCTTQANQSGSNIVTVRLTDAGSLFVDVPFTITVNAVNDLPFGYSFALPLNNTEFNKSLVSFSWNAGTDVENTALTYELQIDNNEAFSSLDYSNTTTMLSVNANLSDGTYYARLRASDGSNGAYTETRTFRIDATAPKITPEEIVSTSLKNLTLVVNTTEVSSCYLRQTSNNFSSMVTSNGLRHTKAVELTTGDYAYEFRCGDGLSNTTEQMSFSVVDSGTPSNTKQENIVLNANVSKTIEVSNKLNISITTSTGAIGSITVAEYVSNPLSIGTGLDSNIIGNFISINAGDDIKNSLTSNIISISYVDGDFDESTIQIYRYNTILGVWENLANVTRDTENNIVTGVSNSFSTYVASASNNPTPSSSSSGGSSSSGSVTGGLKVYVQKDSGQCIQIRKYVLNDYLKKGYVLCANQETTVPKPSKADTTPPIIDITQPSEETAIPIETPSGATPIPEEVKESSNLKGWFIALFVLLALVIGVYYFNKKSKEEE